MEQKPTVDKEAILNKWLDQWFENRPLHFDSIGKILEAMEEYSSSLIKENEELKKVNDTMNGVITQLQSTNEAKEKECDYWKQRCKAAELNISTYSEWHTDTLTCDHIHENAHTTFVAWEEAFKKWQQLKNQKQ